MAAMLAHMQLLMIHSKGTIFRDGMASGILIAIVTRMAAQVVPYSAKLMMTLLASPRRQFSWSSGIVYCF